MNTISTLMKDQMSFPKQLFTKYTMLDLTEADVMLLLHIHRFQTQGIDFPTPTELAESMTFDEQQCSEVLRKLIQKGYMSIEQTHTDNGRLVEVYSLDGLWEALMQDEPAPQQTTETEEEQPNLFVLFEKEFGRPISPFEIETINIWLDEDKQEPALIKAALREAVLMGKLNFKYIDRILREWKKKGIRSVQQAREESKSFRQSPVSQQAAASKEKRDTSVYYNWLDDA
ncbi:chromosome replication initiation protein DnaD [Pontibacillus halophilus JSM 076056 = DSM 19796]|uniref:Chromosome replication initiation protein DnaD n=1 Tax=Pontibacillus halophilus JSM 076056 = DSM 19796 TaxID=1385510 RepID=A0A0A5GLM9_9BACI|nr:DnaD domain-containing protein [Pontibacillus halophilus]KGX92133.1 chromosome replication initiation protein DnaD [Pontibacillus halophilus JSM 076056 = DSM 19796]